MFTSHSSAAELDDFEEIRKKIPSKSNTSLEPESESQTLTPKSEQKKPFKHLFQNILKKKTPENSHSKSDASISPVESPLNETKKKLIFGSNTSVTSGGATVASIQKKIFEPIPEFASPESDHTSPVVPYSFNSPIMKTPVPYKDKEVDLSFDQVSPSEEKVEKILKSPMSPIYRKALHQSTRKWSMVDNLDFEEPNSKSRKLENEKVHPDVNLVSETIYSDSNGSSPLSDFALSSFGGFDDEEEEIEDHPDVLKFMK